MPFEAIRPPQKTPLCLATEDCRHRAGNFRHGGCAYCWADDHRSLCSKAAPVLGGQRAPEWRAGRAISPVDNGPLSCPTMQLPNLAALFKELDVPVVKIQHELGGVIDGAALNMA